MLRHNHRTHDNRMPFARTFYALATGAVLLAAAIAMPTPAPAQGFDIGAMTPDERASFREEVRAYLLENPEIIFEAVAVFEEQQTAAQAGNDMNLVRMNGQAIFDDGYSWVGGNPDGDITLVEFSDYRCSFCRRAFEEIASLLAADGNIRFIVKEFPILGPQSELASRFAIAIHQTAGDDAYGAVHDLLMTFPGDFTAQTLRRIGQELVDAGHAVDIDAVMLRMDAPEVSRVIQENRLLAQRLQINGTPTFVLEDEMIRGFVPAEAMAEMIAALRAEN